MRSGYGEWIEGSALLGLGHVDEALEVSRQSVDNLRSARVKQLLGAGLTTYAKIARQARREKAATEADDEARSM